MKKRPGVSFSAFFKKQFWISIFLLEKHILHCKTYFSQKLSQFLLQYKENSPQEKSILLVMEQPKAILKIN